MLFDMLINLGYAKKTGLAWENSVDLSRSRRFAKTPHGLGLRSRLELKKDSIRTIVMCL